MDKIARIRQEIERLKKYYAECGYPGMGEYEQGNKQGRLDTLDNILSFLDTLSEEPDKSLEEEMEEFFETMPVLEHENIFDVTFQNIARHFAEWQKNQMLKDAVEGEARVGYPFSKPFIDIEQSSAQWCNMMKKFMNGDKVRIVVLKAEEE